MAARFPLFAIYLVAFSCSILHSYCQPSSNTLQAAEVIAENQTLASLNKQFELGFFNPSNSSNQYLGIWYTSPNKTVVWVANGDNPISGGGGSLNLTSEGLLELRNSTGHVIWSRGNSSSNASTESVLLDSGTLVINDTTTGDNSWQSSNELSNTLLPEAHLGYVMLPNLSMSSTQLTSWKNETDPSPGSYVYMLDPSRLYELVIVHEGNVTFRSGPWNGSRWNGMSVTGEDNSVALNLKKIVGGAYFYYSALNTSSAVNTSYIFRLVLTPSGTLSFLRSNQSSDWEEFQRIPPANSVQYSLCGPYGTFNGTQCTCPDAFKPKSPADWGTGNFSRGCARTEPFNCTTATGFVNVTNVKLPDSKNAKVNSSIVDLDSCKMWCMADCSCTAVAILGSQGCLAWFGELIDTVKLVKDTGVDLYIRVVTPPLPPPPPPPPSVPPPLSKESGMKRVKKIVAYAAMPAAIVGSLIIAFIFVQCCRWRRNRIIRFPALNTKIDIEDDELMVYVFSTIKSATNNFSDTNKLGEGQFGLVYKGVLSNGEEIAVKRLVRNSSEEDENLMKEVALLTKLRHPNLVKLLGFCVQEEEVLLCYEYLPNRRLDQLLFENLEDRHTLLDWNMRHSILEGISAGLLYLHEDSGRAIIHCEIMPRNILLDQNMVPKISNFGLSRLFDREGFFVKLCMVTSCGHRAPELRKKKILSTSADVYSFGVLILELVTGESNSSFSSGLIAHVLQYWNEGNVQGLIDPKLAKPYPVDDIRRCIHIALMCLLEQPQIRPKMHDVCHMLRNKQAPLPNLPHNCSYWGLVLADSSTPFVDIALD